MQDVKHFALVLTGSGNCTSSFRPGYWFVWQALPFLFLPAGVSLLVC